MTISDSVKRRQMNDREIILIVGAEGGGVTLYGVKDGGRWRFSLKMIDQTPVMLDGKEIVRDSQYVESWDEALTMLDRYPWVSLSPIRVHPAFRRAVWSAVQQRYTGTNSHRDLARWRDRCDIEA
jgi:hypothetical protein